MPHLNEPTSYGLWSQFFFKKKYDELGGVFSTFFLGLGFFRSEEHTSELQSPA